MGKQFSIAVVALALATLTLAAQGPGSIGYHAAGVAGDVTSNGANTFTALNTFTGGLESYLGTDNEGVYLGLGAGQNDRTGSVNVGYLAGYDTTGTSWAVFVGRHAGQYFTGGNSVNVGHAAGQYAGENGDAGSSVNIGYLAGRNTLRNTPHNHFSSVAIGYGAAEKTKSSQTGVFIGSYAGSITNESIGAVNIGWQAGGAATSSRDSVMIGNEAGRNATAGQYSVLIGSNAGKNLSANRSLVIDGDPVYSAAGTTGLIYGEFGNRVLTVNGLFRVGVQPAKPTCNAANRKFMYYTAGGAGVADAYEVCMKDAADVYAWKVLATP